MDRFVFPRSFYETIRTFKPANREALYSAIFDFIFDDRETELKTVDLQRVWMLIFPILSKAKKISTTISRQSQDNLKTLSGDTQENVETISRQSPFKEKEKEKDKEKDNIPPVIPPKGGKFVPPTLDEVKAYIKEKGYDFDAEEFLAHYEANGWVQGNDKKTIKSWKACCVTWKKNCKRYDTKNSFHDKAYGTDQNVEVGF